ncbi:MAG: TIGR01906 family membrane protein [Fastidiosipilaceae bacterium]|jgi:integral membrane protein (TIGR01906 family)
MKKVALNVGLFVWAQALIIALLLISVDVHSFYRPLYDLTYERMDTAREIGISELELQQATTILLDYIRDDRGDLDLTVSVDGVDQPMFNEREVKHMIDVKVLYRNAMNVKWICLGTFVVGLVALIAIKKQDRAVLFFRAIKIALAVSLIAMSIVFIFLLVDFEQFWTSFHKVFFSNDLWILDPRTDNLILMVPSMFFNRLVKRIVVTFFGAILLLLIANVAYVISRGRKQPANCSAER